MEVDWEEAVLGDHVELVTGEAFQSAFYQTSRSSGIRVARGDNVKEGEFEWGDKERFWPKLTPDLERYLLQEGDVLIGMDGSKVGKNWVQVRKNDLPCLLVQRVARLRTKPSMDQRFLRFLIGNPEFREYVGRVKTGTSIPHISGGQIKEYRVTLPPLPVQKAIAHILGTLDEKIELNRRMNETLDALAAEFFKARFAAATQAQPPKGWTTRSLGELIDVKHGFSFEGQFFSDEQTHDILLTPGNFAIGGGFKADKFKYYHGPVPNDFVLAEEDVLVTMTDLSKAGDTLGYPALLPSPPEGHRFLHNQRLGKVIVLDERILGKSFLFQILRSQEYRAEILGSATGTTVRHTSPGRIKAFKLHLPPPDLIEEFEKVTGMWMRKIAYNVRESRTLVTLRDTLSPKLLAGRLRIPQLKS